MSLENMLNEISQSQKTTYIWFHLYEMSRLGKSIQIERDKWLPRPEHLGGKLEMTTNGHKVSSENVECVLKWIVVLGVDLCEHTKPTKVYTLNGWIVMWIISWKTFLKSHFIQIKRKVTKLKIKKQPQIDEVKRIIVQ